MKNYFKYIAVSACWLLSSCSSEFLELNPVSSAVSDNFYKTADDIKNAVNGGYAALQLPGVSTNSYQFGEIPSDNATPVASGTVTDRDEFDRFYLRTTNPYILERWNDCYNAIARYNAVLEKIDAVNLDKTLKDRYIGEMKFLRAYVYFELVRTFGDVPLVLNAISNPDDGYQFKRNPQAEVYAQIEKDLTEAEPILPVSYSRSDIGRVTRGAAKGLLGKVFLTQGKFAQASTKLKEVIDLGVYKLLPDYSAVFDVKNKNHQESVFDIQFMSGGAGEGNPWPNQFAPAGSGNAVIQFGGSGNNRPTQDLINAFETGDKRKDVSVGTSYIGVNGQVIYDNYVKKYFDVPASNNDNGNNIPVIRYSDVLLMYAESLNEIGFKQDGEALGYLNQVRVRAGLKSKTASELASQEQFRIAIEQERRVEFAFENQRWYDLVRTKRALPVLNSKKAEMNFVNSLTENNFVFPVPQSQIDINAEKIKQNPGY
jgi:hypothetical protein